jgi:hypothetical protein
VDRAELRRKLLKTQAEAGESRPCSGMSPTHLPISIWLMPGPRRVRICVFQCLAKPPRWHSQDQTTSMLPSTKRSGCSTTNDIVIRWLTTEPLLRRSRTGVIGTYDKNS